ncbi:MAG TPA: nucleotidyl transferase AbiEii/AbiGii toxin family protein [Pirellulales bacterium]
MTDFESLIRRFVDAKADFILIGGVAATVHGSARLTRDIDFVYARDDANLARVVAALDGTKAYLRGAPPGLPFRFDEETIRHGLNFTLTCDLGDVDLLGEVTGGGTYGDLLPHSMLIEVLGAPCRCLDLPTLIRVKRAAGRPKDMEAIAELEALYAEQKRAPE